MSGLFIYFGLALGVSFLCSLLEAVLLSVSLPYAEALTKEKHRSGTILKHLKERVDRPLAAILTLNTIANTVGAAGVGAQALKLANAAWPESNNNKWVALASGILTLSILVFSEIIPKTLGAVHWKRLAPSAGYVIRGMIFGLYPLVVLFEVLSGWLSRHKYRQKRTSREEMMAVAEIGRDEGILQGHENSVIQNLLRLNKIRAKDVLTPRNVMLAFSQAETVGQVVQKYSPIRFSRVPIYDRDLDDITGIVHRYKVLQAYSHGSLETQLESIASPIHAIPDTKSIASTLDEFIKRQEHIFLVVDEYGGTEGIITLEDVIETLLGVEIVDEFDSVEDMRKLARELWDRRKRDHQL